MRRAAATGHDAGMQMSRPAAPGTGTSAQPTASTSGVLALPGARIAYEVTGNGPAVVLVHGFGLDLRMWDAQVGQLAEGFRVVRYDCRGIRVLRAVRPRCPLHPCG